MVDISRLTKKLGYEFTNPKLLKQALTHRSAHTEHNERFEFLGDSILSTVISYALYQQFTTQSEGVLSRMRAHLVKGETLASIALELNLGEYLILGQGELKSGGFRRASILADAFEAILAAIFLDAGFATCERVILKLYQTRLQPSLEQIDIKDPKTTLQEYLQANKYPLPEYTLIKKEENEHESIFFVSCSVPQLKCIPESQGDTRRKAEQNAARNLLKLLKIIC